MDQCGNFARNVQGECREKVCDGFKVAFGDLCGEGGVRCQESSDCGFVFREGFERLVGGGQRGEVACEFLGLAKAGKAQR